SKSFGPAQGPALEVAVPPGSGTVAVQQAIAASPFLGVSSLNSRPLYSAAFFLPESPLVRQPLTKVIALRFLSEMSVRMVGFRGAFGRWPCIRHTVPGSCGESVVSGKPFEYNVLPKAASVHAMKTTHAVPWMRRAGITLRAASQDIAGPKNFPCFFLRAAVFAAVRGVKNRRRRTEALHACRELSYRFRRYAHPPQSTGAVPMDIAIMVLAVAFFFWQTISD
ncbi:MAG: hypothetical protein ACLGJC_29045, partial [Alphaproteobacteria bacterium]